MSYNFKKKIEESENYNHSSDMPINPFIGFENLNYKNVIAYLNEITLDNNAYPFAGIQLKLPWQNPFSLILVHGYHKSDAELVTFIFVSRELAEEFALNELEDPIFWELVDINLEQMRKNRKVPEVYTNQLPIE